MSQQMYGVYIMTRGEWWSYPICTGYSKASCVDEFCAWLSGLPDTQKYPELSMKVVPVIVTEGVNQNATVPYF